MVERLLADLGALRDRIWLVIDDVHVLGSAKVLRQLEMLLVRAPAEMRFVLATRHELRLGLHRLRLEGELTEVRGTALQFSLDETRALFEGAGVGLSESALDQLYERTEGWAAGLRMAALSLAGDTDPERLAAEFCGSERTVAGYMLAEVLEGQSEEARPLSRTSVLEPVSGPLADRLTGGSGGRRILLELEQAGAFVFALDARRCWFRYHPLFADLLELELCKSDPTELAGLHATAADWFVRHGFPVEAVRHAQAARDWERAGRLLADHWIDITLTGQGATVHQLFSSFPEDTVAANPELAAVAAAEGFSRGSLEKGARYFTIASAGVTSVPAEKRERFRITLTVLRLYLARQRGDLLAVGKEMEQLQSAVALDVGQLGLGEELRSLSLISLGIAELWTLRLDEAEGHLERGVALARRIRRPFLEVIGMAHWGLVASFRSATLAVKRGGSAIELEQRHGWGGERIVAMAYPMLAGSLIWLGELEEAERWVTEREYALASDIEPATGGLFHLVRGLLEIARGRVETALTCLRTVAELPGRRVIAGRPLTTELRALILHVLVRQGETAQADAVLAETTEVERERRGIRIAVAAFRLAQDNPRAASAVLTPVLESSARGSQRMWLTAAFLLEASVRHALGEQEAAARALERGLNLAESDGLLFPFTMHPVPELLERYQCQASAHSTLIRKITILLGAATPTTLDQKTPAALVTGQPEHLPEPLSQAEVRVLRFLQTNLSAPEMARELYVSVNTVRTHTRHLYDKLGAHRRMEALERARALGLLAPIPQGA
jgi:LuxR family transcriptional regulator, maltose regulon positive regulatory protein